MAKNETKAVETYQAPYVPVSFEDALRHFEAEGIVEFAGSPYNVVDKESLIGVPFLIVDYRFNEEGSYGRFVSVLAVTETDDRVVINDGSTGVMQQIDMLAQTYPDRKGILCKGGLRRSDYTYTDTDGKEKPASTYYIA